MRRFYIALRLLTAGVAWFYLAVMLAFIRAEALGPNLDEWRNQQWQELRTWALNPSSEQRTAEEIINLKFSLPSSALILSGVLVRVFSANLFLIAGWGFVGLVVSVGMMRRYVRAKSALGAEIEFGPKGFLAFWSIAFCGLYAFLVFLTGALRTS